MAGRRVIEEYRARLAKAGWSARAHCYRRTITLEVVAARGPLTPRAGVEDHEY